jgi:RNA polymerase sigma-70 factor (ECF subfamily)
LSPAFQALSREVAIGAGEAPALPGPDMKTADAITDVAPNAAQASRIALPPESVADLFRDARAADFGFKVEDFAALLGEIAAKYLPQPAGQAEVTEFCRRLHLRELMLARACAAGNEDAWNQFLARYRESINRSAAAITRAEDAAHDLADSIYAELYGLGTREGQRSSKLAFYDGRGSLEGWLRSVLVHEHLNRWRNGRRLVSLEEQVDGGSQFPAPERAADSLPDPRLESATDEALAALSAEDRYLLASYYLDGQTLAGIAGLAGVHESTISRRLDRVTSAITKQIVKGLRRSGMSRDQAREALETDVRDLGVDVRRHLSGARNPAETVLSTGAKESS